MYVHRCALVPGGRQKRKAEAGVECPGIRAAGILSHLVDGGNRILNLLERQPMFFTYEPSISLALSVHPSSTFGWVKSPE